MPSHRKIKRRMTVNQMGRPKRTKVHPGNKLMDAVRFDVRTVLEGSIRVYVSSRMVERQNMSKINRVLSNRSLPRFITRSSSRGCLPRVILSPKTKHRTSSLLMRRQTTSSLVTFGVRFDHPCYWLRASSCKEIIWTRQENRCGGGDAHGGVLGRLRPIPLSRNSLQS